MFIPYAQPYRRPTAETTLTFYAGAMADVRPVLEKFVKKAIRMAIVPAATRVEDVFAIGPVRVATERHTTQIDGDELELRTVERSYEVEVVDVTINIRMARLAYAGYTLAAVIEPLGDTFLVKTVPGVELDPAVVTDAQRCDHCGTHRRRTTTYLVRGADGALKQVGKSCLREFLGTDTATLLAPLSWQESFYRLVNTAMDEHDWAFGGGRRWGRPLMTPQAYMEVAVYAARVLGYRSKAAVAAYIAAATAAGTPADEVKAPATTAGEVGWLLSEKTDRASQQEFARFVRTNGWVTDEDKAEAARLLAWAPTAVKADDTYGHNIRALCGASLIDRAKHGGFLSSIIGMWQATQKRAEERAAREANAPAKQPWTAGRQVVTGTVIKRVYRESDFGGAFKLTVARADGSAVWFTEPGAWELPVGTQLTVTLTIEVSDRDATFAFGSRPAKVAVLDPAA